MAKGKQTFESNPFKVIFNGFDKLFKYNQTMAIVIMAFSLFGFMSNFFNVIPSSFVPPTTTTQTSVTDNQTKTTRTAELYTGAAAEPSGAPLALILIILGAVSTVIIIVVTINVFISGFMAFIAYKTSRQETATFSESMSAVFKNFWTIFLVQIVVGFKVLGGILLFIVPGIRAIIRYNMVLLPVFDEDAKTKQAIATTKKLAKNNLLEIFGMSFAAGIIPFIGQTFLVGGQSIMYPQLKALDQGKLVKPKTHWLNYLPFIVIGGFTLLIALMAMATLLLLAN